MQFFIAFATADFASFEMKTLSYTVLKRRDGIITFMNFVVCSRYLISDIVSWLLNSSVQNINAFFEIFDLKFSTESLANYMNNSRFSMRS